MSSEPSAARLALARIALWGAAWGLAEATLGHVLHLARVPGLAGFVMAPIGLLAMGRAFLATGRLWAVPAVSALAASLKLADLFASVGGPHEVLRPALAILAEGLAAAALLAALRRPAARRAFEKG